MAFTPTIHPNTPAAPSGQSDGVFVRDLMTPRVLTIGPDQSILEAAQVLFEKNFDGLPVADETGTLLGILTQYDLVSKGANIHLPTFIELMKNLPLYSKDKNLIRPGLQQIVSLRVRDLMNTDPLTITPDASIEEAARLFTEHHRVNPMPVIDEEHKIVGVISRYDLIKLYTGNVAAAAVAVSDPKVVDQKLDLFVHHFSKNFTVVSKFRTRIWFIWLVVFLIIGFLVATAFIIRIEIR